MLDFILLKNHDSGGWSRPHTPKMWFSKCQNIKEHTSTMKYCENHWYCASDIQLVQNILPENAFSMVVLFLSHFYTFLKLKST